MIAVLPKHKYFFPPVESADSDGLLAIGGDLSPERLLAAYRSGIFPWYSENSDINWLGNNILWWSPDPRFVLYPKKMHISKSMKKLLKQNRYKITINKAFPSVINHCRHEPRTKQEGTWITQDMEDAYNELHRLGYAISVEAWLEDTLAGGLYGVLIGRAFFGESMFTLFDNASKAAFITFVSILKKAGCPIIDCQVETEHLKTLGAETIPRKKFLKAVSKAVEMSQIDFNKV